MTLEPLAAGPLSMLFDTSNAFLRHVRLGNRELIRGVFAAVRDHNWDTVPFSIDNLRVQQKATSFSVEFIARSLMPEIDFTWTGTIQGSSEGDIQYGFQGLAEAIFFRNRIGLCVLHPTSVVSGQSCRVEHVDGSVTDGIFPVLISPHQPFKNVRSISHEVAPNVRVRVTMRGDTFETEDQRNWTDASYKTYSTPLDIPFPVRVEPGSKIEQSVSISLVESEPSAIRGLARRREVVAQDAHHIDIDWGNPLRRPYLGFQWCRSHQLQVHPNAIKQLQAIRPDHIRFDIWLTSTNWRKEFENAMQTVLSIETQAELAIFVDNMTGVDWQACCHMLSRWKSQISRVLILDTISQTTSTDLSRAATKSLNESVPGLQMVVGTNAYFAELNRSRPWVGVGCHVCYSINPQVHAFDNLSLAETLEAQRMTVDTAVSLFDTEVVISPVTLRPRFNPNATKTIDPERQLVAAVDARQTMGFGAAWTVGVFASLFTHPKVYSVTLFEAFGPRGIIQYDGSEYPMTSAIKHLLLSRSLFQAASGCSMELVAFGTQAKDGGKHLMVGNLSDRELVVSVRTPSNLERSIHVAAASMQVLSMERSDDA